MCGALRKTPSFCLRCIGQKPLIPYPRKACLAHFGGLVCRRSSWKWWVQSIHLEPSSSRNAVLSHGHMQSFGISQGCPLPPYLCIILMTVLIKDARDKLRNDYGLILPEDEHDHNVGCVLMRTLYRHAVVMVFPANEIANQRDICIQVSSAEYGGYCGYCRYCRYCGSSDFCKNHQK